MWKSIIGTGNIGLTGLRIYASSTHRPAHPLQCAPQECSSSPDAPWQPQDKRRKGPGEPLTQGLSPIRIVPYPGRREAPRAPPARGSHPPTAGRRRPTTVFRLGSGPRTAPNHRAVGSSGAWWRGRAAQDGGAGRSGAGPGPGRRRRPPVSSSQREPCRSGHR